MNGLPALVALCLLASSAEPALAADATQWKPKGVSSPQFESHAAFDPLTGDFYFVRSSPKFEGWRILVTRCESKGWSKPEPPFFAGIRGSTTARLRPRPPGRSEPK
jgi:hypothetical protein